ncbi:MFS transporter [Candidatus Poriferisodalis sp.]|uniref:MFS transporter n=1 Tax=Candidatus Poriferisodalis sp. TaxID=3101277 RepID=UPI003B52BA58
MTESRATAAPGGPAPSLDDCDAPAAASAPDPGLQSTPAGSSAAPAKMTTFATLAVPAFRALWLSGVFSFMAIQMQFLLRGWLAWELTERESALGTVFFFFGLALLVSTPLGGVAADRLPKRPLLIAGQLILLLTALGMGIALATDIIQFWMLVVSSALQGLMFGLIGPARISMTTELVGRERMGNAITLSSLSLSGSRVFAPSLAGILAGWALVGLSGTYFVSSALAALSLVLLFPLPATPRARRDASASRTRPNPLAEIRLGVRYAMSRPGLRRTILISLFVMMFGFNYVAFMPAFVEGEFGLGVFEVGLISSVGSIGAVVAATLLARHADGPHAGSLLVAAGFGFGVTVAVLSTMPSFWLACVVSLGIGASSTGFMALTQTLGMRATTEAYQGRVQSLLQLPFAMFALMALPLGALAEWVGVRGALATMGVGVVVAMSLYVVAFRRAEMADAEP